MVNGSILFLGLLLLFSIGGLSLAIQVVFLVLAISSFSTAIDEYIRLSA